LVLTGWNGELISPTYEGPSIALFDATDAGSEVGSAG
jgi:hypothetical protein